MIIIKGRNQKGTISAGETRYLPLKISVEHYIYTLYKILQDLAACQSVFIWVTPRTV